MSFILNALITVFTLAATSVVLPTIPLSLLRLVLRCVGWFIEKRTKSRREFITSRVRVDEEEFQTKRGSGDVSAKSSSSTSQTEDEDWEKVDSSAGIGNNGNGGDKEKSGRGKAQGQGTKDEDWEGIIGFFHPFWYVLLPWSTLHFALTMMEQQRRWRGRTCALGGVESNSATLAKGDLCCLYGRS